MTLTNEQTEQIKERLLKQLSNFSKDKREQITQQVNTMTPNQIEDFIKQNQLTHLGGQCIFCSIISGETLSLRIAENENNIAILEINPLSKGHTLIVPREHSMKIESSTQDLAKEVKEKLQEKFNPKRIELKEINVMGHPLVAVVPIYGGETERKQATEEELKTLQEEILKKPKLEEPKSEEVTLDIKEKLFKTLPRIPN
ncbi:MAG: HIT domain-containing protein [Nanoarchaeota archaeon]|nr:HIT domain-containing protein [Nanoarchaeota archaeon]